jgi:hypothetical protein
MVAHYINDFTPAARVRELLDVAVPALQSISVTPVALPEEEVAAAFDDVRSLSAKMIEQGIANPIMFELFVAWENRYISAPDLTTIALEDIGRISNQADAAYLSLNNENMRLALAQAKIFAWSLALLVEAVTGIWRVLDGPSVAALQNLAQVSDDLLQVVMDNLPEDAE